MAESVAIGELPPDFGRGLRSAHPSGALAFDFDTMLLAPEIYRIPLSCGVDTSHRCYRTMEIYRNKF